MGLILASQSPRRRELLSSLGLPFRVVPSRVSEASSEKRPQALVQELALRKARAVASRLRSGTVLGADTVVVLKNQILGQPQDAQEAYRMLYRLSGTTHHVFTGVAVVDVKSGRDLVDYAKSRVRMKKIPLEMILKLSRQHLDKAGSYAIQEKKDPIAAVVSGAYDTVVGLPLTLVRRLLRQAGLPVR